MTLWFNLKNLFHRSDPVGPPPWPAPAMDEADEAGQTPSISPLAAPVHVYAGSATVQLDNGVLVVERQSEPRFERPVELVSAVHIHGWATITSPCVAELIRQGTPVVWRSASGYPIGCTAPLHQRGLEARRAQYAAVGTPKGLAIARALVRAKIVNLRGLVRRRASLAGRDCLDVLHNHARQAEVAPTLDRLLGIEGADTARYFTAWPEMISARAGDLTLDTRTRRPPQDEVNALLSYAYAVLLGECLSACAASGLDARQGFLHRPRPGRPALALDLMEPFRPVIADQAVLSGLNNGRARPEHFRADGHAVLLTEEGRRLALNLLEDRLLCSVTLEGRTEPVAWRQAIGISAQSLADTLKNETTYVAVERP